MKVILVTHDSAFGRYVAATLASACQIDRIIVETSRASKRFYIRKLLRVGLVNFVFQYFLARRFAAEGKRALPQCVFPPHERVSSINTVSIDDDALVIGFGTSYVTAKTLAACPRGMLNLHTGILPHYRGVKSEFWALYNDEPSELGWTLHYMTPQLDAGDIVAQGRIQWNEEHPAVARARIVRDAVPVIAQLLNAIHANPEHTVTRAKQNEAEASYYSTPTWREWREAHATWRWKRGGRV